MKVGQLRYLIVSLTSRCNLRCKYCYSSATCNGADMSDEVLEKTVSLADNGGPLLLQITGGEPTLVPEKIDKLARLCSGMKNSPKLAVQTNGTLLTPSLVELFLKYEIQVGVSLDGPPDIQERLRGKANETFQGLQLLERSGVPFRVTTVLCESTVFTLDKLVLLLAGFSCCRGIGLDLLVNRGRASTSDVFPATAQQLVKGLRKMVVVLTAINRKRASTIQLRELGREQQGGASTCFCHAASGTSLAVDPEGSLAPCGQPLGDPAFSGGTVFKPNSESRVSLESITLQSNECSSCSLEHRCPGDCPSRVYYNREETTPLACIMYRCLDELQKGLTWRN